MKTIVTRWSLGVACLSALLNAGCLFHRQTVQGAIELTQTHLKTYPFVLTEKLQERGLVQKENMELFPSHTYINYIFVKRDHGTLTGNDFVITDRLDFSGDPTKERIGGVGEFIRIEPSSVVIHLFIDYSVMKAIAPVVPAVEPAPDNGTYQLIREAK